MLRKVAESSGMHHSAIPPFPGNGGMPFISIIFDFLPSVMDLLGGHKVFYTQYKYEILCHGLNDKH